MAWSGGNENFILGLKVGTDAPRSKWPGTDVGVGVVRSKNGSHDVGGDDRRGGVSGWTTRRERRTGSGRLFDRGLESRPSERDGEVIDTRWKYVDLYLVER